MTHHEPPRTPEAWAHPPRVKQKTQAERYADILSRLARLWAAVALFAGALLVTHIAWTYWVTL